MTRGYPQAVQAGETRLVMFMEGSHVFRSNARPSIRKRRLTVMLDWFDKHLKV